MPRLSFVVYCANKATAPDEIVITEGDVGDAFYIIFSGSVTIYLRNTEAKAKEEERKRRQSVAAVVHP